jgi:hypothetical protein
LIALFIRNYSLQRAVRRHEGGPETAKKTTEEQMVVQELATAEEDRDVEKAESKDTSLTSDVDEGKDVL